MNKKSILGVVLTLGFSAVTGGVNFYNSIPEEAPIPLVANAQRVNKIDILKQGRDIGLQRLSVNPSNALLKFNIKKLKISSVDGTFNISGGKLEYAKVDQALLSTEIKIDVNSLETLDEDRNTHLKSEDFFNTKKFKFATFKLSDSVIVPLNTVKNVEGTLNLHGVKKNIVLQLELSQTKLGLKADIKAVIDRNAFGLNWNKKQSKLGFLKTSIVGRFATLNGEVNFKK